MIARRYNYWRFLRSAVVQGWNQHFFLLINTSAHPAGSVVQAALLLANSPVVVGPATLVILWIWGRPSQRGGLLAVTGGMLIALGINQVLGMLYFEPRPFMIGLGHTLLPHPPDNSFPSDHATFVWALGIGLIATRATPRIGGVVSVYGLSVAWSRVFVGVHFPLDMLVSAAVGLVGGEFAAVVRPMVATWVLPPAERLYEGTLTLLHVPHALLPRRDSLPR